MTRLIRTASAALLLAALAFAPRLGLAHGNDRGLVKANVGGAHVAIQYGRPKLNDRDPMKLIQPGELWRMGADIPTTIESDAALDFGGTKVPKGKHFLLARLVEPGKWTLIVSRQPINKYEPSAKLAEVPMELREQGDPAQKVTITLTSKGGRGVFEVSWGDAHLTASFARAK